MAEERAQGRLAAIVAADVVGAWLAYKTSSASSTFADRIAATVAR
jgi:hypothetical protein